MKFKMIPKGVLMLTQHVGFAEEAGGVRFEMLISVPACQPIIAFGGRRAMLDWNDMIPEARALIEAELTNGTGPGLAFDSDAEIKEDEAEIQKEAGEAELEQEDDDIESEAE